MNGVPCASLAALMFLTYKTLHNSTHMDGMAKRREKTYTHRQLLRQRCGGVRIATTIESPHGLLTSDNVSSVEGVGTGDTVVLVDSPAIGDLCLGGKDFGEEVLIWGREFEMFKFSNRLTCRRIY